MKQCRSPVVENVRLAERTFRVRLRVPEIASAIRPGQFVMLRLPGTSDPLLGRPFAFYDTDGEWLDVVYLVVGKMTRLLAEVRAGDALEIWGPLGNGFLPLPTTDRVTLVAGGIGQTPFLAYANQLLGKRGYAGNAAASAVRQVDLYYGVRSAELLAGVDDFNATGVKLHFATDDGSAGHHGFVTDLLKRDAPPGPWVGCGPEPMLHALRKVAAERGVVCHVSLETPMACGFGVCFSCVTRVKTDDGWDYKRVCVDGPVFDAARLCD